MSETDTTVVDEYPEPARLEMIWGEGFMSPGGADEVSRIVGDADIAGLSVLDVGCGVGGADVVLVERHGAGSVLGLDVQPLLIDRARERAERLGLGGIVGYRLAAPGPLPVEDETFDAVFSKDALIHVADKVAIYAETYRVLRPGGLLLVGDWLTGDPGEYADLAEELIALSGHDFHLASLRTIGSIAARCGFADIELVDRRDWYLDVAREELARFEGAFGDAFRAVWGEESYDGNVAFWRVLVRAVEAGVLRPGHIRARKPA